MIKLPEFDDEWNLHVVLVKRYRMEENGEKKTKYTFFKIGLKKSISDQLKQWLLENFEKLKDVKVMDYNPSVELEELEKVDLRGIDVWEDFEKKAFIGINNREIKLKEIRYGLSGIIICMKKGNKFYGQIKRLFPSQVLYRKGFFTLFLGEDTFNDLREETGIRLSKKADFIFYGEEKNAEGIILDKENFKAVFDLWEEYRKKAINNSKKIKLFEESKCFGSLCDSIEKDRQIQKMLINPIIEKYLNDLSYSDLVSLKEGAPDLCFELDKENEDFILPSGKEKEAIKDLIKAVSGRFGFSINQKHLVENSGIRRVLN